MITDKGQKPKGRLLIIILNSLSFIDCHKLIVKIWPPYVFWMYLLEHYGDPTIPPFLEDLLPQVAANSSSDEITPQAPIAPTNPVTTINALDLV